MVAKEHTAKIMKESTHRMQIEHQVVQSTLEGRQSNVERNSVSSRGNSMARLDEGLDNTELKQVEGKIVKDGEVY